MVNQQPHIYMSVAYHLCVSSQSFICQQPIITSDVSILSFISVAYHLYVSSLSIFHMSAAYTSFICQYPIIYVSEIYHLYVNSLSFISAAYHLYVSSQFHVQFSCLSVICWLTVGQQPEEGLLYTITSHSAVAFVKPFKCFT